MVVVNGCEKDSLDPQNRQNCNTASDLLNQASKRYTDSSKVKKSDTLFQNVNYEIYAFALRNYIQVNLQNDCFSNRSSDSTNNYRILSNVPGKCNQALLAINIAERSYLKTFKVPTDSLNCSIYSKALYSYLNVSAAYNCLTSAEREQIVKKAKSLNCLCDHSLSVLLIANQQYQSSLTTIPKDDIQVKKNCLTFSSAIKSYLVIGSKFKCFTSQDSLFYSQTLKTLICQ